MNNKNRSNAGDECIANLQTSMIMACVNRRVEYILNSIQPYACQIGLASLLAIVDHFIIVPMSYPKNHALV